MIKIMKDMTDKVKALLCENDILEQLMSIPVTEIISYSRKADSVDPEDALRYLAEMYIDNCGVSTGLRSFADYCSVFWIERLKHFEYKETASKYGEMNTLPELLPLLSDNYTAEIDNYDISFMSDVDLRAILIEELSKVLDEKSKIILCAGICDILPQMSTDRWLESYRMETIEDAIINLKDKTLIRYRYDKNVAKYYPRFRLYPTNNGIVQKLDTQPLSFTKEEVRHFEVLNKRLVELQHEVMEKVRDITLNLQEQIAKGFHQFDNFNVEGLIHIENMDEDVDSFFNILADHVKYKVMGSNERSTPEVMDKFIEMNNHWYGNVTGIFSQLESVHNLKVCRAFCNMFEEAKVFTIADIMKLRPDMLLSQVIIYI